MKKIFLLFALVTVFTSVKAQYYVVEQLDKVITKQGYTKYVAKLVSVGDDYDEFSDSIPDVEIIDFVEKDPQSYDFLPILESGDTLYVGRLSVVRIITRDGADRKKEVQVNDRRGRLRYTRIYELKKGNLTVTTVTYKNVTVVEEI